MKFQETETVELKRILNDSCERAIVAFLNTMDGVIYIGVDDDGGIIGVEKLDETLKKIADIVTTQILPNPQEFIELGTKFLEGRQVIEIKVRKGTALYYIKKYGRSASGCYVRVGTSNRSMTEEQIEKFYRKTLQIEERAITEIRSSRQNLSFQILKQALIGKGYHINEETFLMNFSLL